MALPVVPVRADPVQPPRTGVVVIGGGIVGVCTALYLAEQGVPVVLCEKGIIAGEQSSRNQGWCRKMGRDPRELPLAIESMRLWTDMDRHVQGNTGFFNCGTLYLADTREELAKHEAWLEHARQYQLDTRLVTDADIHRIMPGAAGTWAGGLYTPSDGRAEPQQAAPAIAEAARRAGATVLTNCAVRGIERQAGRVAAVVTERGRIACDTVVLAGGAWSSLFCANLGIRLPQLKVRTSVFSTAKLEGAPEISALGSGFISRRRQDGGYNLMQHGGETFDLVPDSVRFFSDFLPIAKQNGTRLRYRLGERWIEEVGYQRRWALDETTVFEKVRVLDPAPNAASLAAGRANAARNFPAFGTAVEAVRWAGMIDLTPDAVPVISTVDALPGFIIATGFSGHGFGIGPGAGRLIADMARGATPVVDPTPFRIGRFDEGPVRPGPAI
jgi:glycine/D-amino acid oxidase-like deaminating enzyme